MIGRGHILLEIGENLHIRLDGRAGGKLLAHQYVRERGTVQQFSRPSKNLHRNFLVGFRKKVVWVYNGQVGGVGRGYCYGSTRERRAKDGQQQSIIQSWSSRKG